MTGGKGFLRSQLWSIILIILIIIMGVEILLLVRENQKLRKALSRSRGSYKVLRQADKVPSLIGINLDDEEFKIEYPSSKRTVLFWFSPVCPSCEENLDFWKEIYQKSSSEKLKFIGVTNFEKEKTEEFVNKFQLDFPVLIISDISLIDKYKVEIVPQTILIDTNGIVQKVWPGPLPEKYKKEIREMIFSSDKL